MSSGWYVGVDVGGTLTKAVLIDRSRKTLRSIELPTGDVLPTVLRAVELVGGDPARIGVAVPGVVDRDSGRVAGAVNLGLATATLDLRAELETRLGRPCRFENDTNAAALAASVRLGMPDLALLSIGTGLAAGIVFAGRVWHGTRGSAGEVGHLPFGLDAALCACGARGCLEATASGGAVKRRCGVTVSEVLAADPAVAAEFADGLSRAVEALLLVLDVDVVLAGGAASPRLLQLVQSRLVERSADSAFRRALALPERLHLIGHDTALGAYGAALVACDD